MNYVTNNRWAHIALRVGLALTLLWGVFTKFTGTAGTVELFGALGLGFATPGIVIIIAIGLLIISISLIAGKFLQEVGTLLSIYFSVSLIAGIFAGDALFSVGPAIWKDFALLGIALYFAFAEKNQHEQM